MIVEDPHNLSRFKQAQDRHNSYNIAVNELRRGRKESHWIWYVFPQIKGLGQSEIAKHYSIQSLEEAGAYFDDEFLGDRFEECCNILLELPESNPVKIFGELDAMKVRSSMTLFSETHANPTYLCTMKQTGRFTSTYSITN